MNLHQIVAERQRAAGGEDVIVVVQTLLGLAMHDTCGLTQLAYLRWHEEPTTLAAQVNADHLEDVEPSFGRARNSPDEVTVYLDQAKNSPQWPAILLMLAAHRRNGDIYVEPPQEERKPTRDMTGWEWTGKRKSGRSRRRGGM